MRSMQLSYAHAIPGVLFHVSIQLYVATAWLEQNCIHMIQDHLFSMCSIRYMHTHTHLKTHMHSHLHTHMHRYMHADAHTYAYAYA